MALRREFVEFLAEKISDELVDQALIEVPRELHLKDTLFEVLNEEIMVEDRLNEEVRTLLNEYSNQMREKGASYQEMFKLVKRKLARERKLVL